MSLKILDTFLCILPKDYELLLKHMTEKEIKQIAFMAGQKAVNAKIIELENQNTDEKSENEAS